MTNVVGQSDALAIFLRERSERCDSLKKALNLWVNEVEEWKNRYIDSVGRLCNLYREGGAWLFCEIKFTHRGLNKVARLACREADCAVVEFIGPKYKIGSYPGNGHGCKEQPVLVGIAEFIQQPKIMASPTLVCFHMIEKTFFEGFGDCLVDSPGQVIFRVGKGETALIDDAGGSLADRYKSVIKGASEIAHGIPKDEIDFLIDIMEGFKLDQSAGVPLVRLNAQSVEVCIEKRGNLNLQIVDVFASAV